MIKKNNESVGETDEKIVCEKQQQVTSIREK